MRLLKFPLKSLLTCQNKFLLLCPTKFPLLVPRVMKRTRLLRSPPRPLRLAAPRPLPQHGLLHPFPPVISPGRPS
jgi:hypothetical protein